MRGEPIDEAVLNDTRLKTHRGTNYGARWGAHELLLAGHWEGQAQPLAKPVGTWEWWKTVRTGGVSVSNDPPPYSHCTNLQRQSGAGMRVVLSRAGLSTLIIDLGIYPLLGLGALGLPVAVVLSIDRFHPFIDPTDRSLLLFLVAVAGLGGVLYGSAKALTDYRKLRTLAQIDDFMDDGGRGSFPVEDKSVYRSGGGFRQFRSTRVDALSPRSPVPPHFHLEYLHTDQRTVVESSLVRTHWSVQHTPVPTVGERRYALVANRDRNRNVGFFLGKPPELTGGRDRRRPLPPADIVILDPRDEGVFLWRFTVDGVYAGDTWHRNTEEAKQQAASSLRVR